MFRSFVRGLVTAAVVLATIGFLATNADARIGSGLSSGSRGARTFSAPPSTSTAIGAAPFQRSVTQPGYGNPGMSGFGPSTGGFFNRGGLLGGLAAGFLGAGLFGLLFGHGFMGGLGGILSFFGLLFQIGLIAIIAMFVWRYFQRRSEPAFAGPMYRDGTNVRPLGLVGGGAGGGPRGDDVGITGADFDTFERTLGEIQVAYSNEDVNALRDYATPEMVSYFSEDLAQNASRGVQNRVSNVKLLQGDLSEAWREGNTEYATVAMRFQLTDVMVDRRTQQVVEGNPNRLEEATEFWTFRRAHGGPWLLSAIQQTK